MALPIEGNSGVVAEVRGTSFRAMSVACCPLDYGSFGHYQGSFVTGILPAALAAGGVIYSFRWGDTTRFAVVTYISLEFQALTMFTAATATDFGFAAYVGRAFTGAYTGGTQTIPSGNAFKTRTSMGASLVTEFRTATTAAFTGGVITLDSHAFEQSLGDHQETNSARANPANFVWAPRVADGEHPLVFAQDEGFIIRNRTVWPAAGTGVAKITVRWREGDSY